MWNGFAMQFTAVPQSVGAPLRTVTVRDAISDLPVIDNGHDQAEMQYAGELYCFVTVPGSASSNCAQSCCQWSGACLCYADRELEVVSVSTQSSISLCQCISV